MIIKPLITSLIHRDQKWLKNELGSYIYIYIYIHIVLMVLIKTSWFDEFCISITFVVHQQSTSLFLSSTHN